MRYFSLFSVLLTLGLLTGCDSVTVKAPLGEAATVTERAKWIGVWGVLEDDGDDNRVEVAQTTKGELVAASLEWKEEKGLFEAANVFLSATQLDGHGLIHARPSADAAKNKPWSVSRYEFVDPDTLRVFAVKSQAFEQAVQAGTLQGTIEKKKHSTTVHLASANADVEAFLRKVGIKACFLEKPIVLKRK